MGGGIVQRITDLLQVIDPLTLCAGVMTILAIVLLAMMRQRLALFTILFTCLTLQSIAIPAVDRGASLLRMMLLGVLALLALAFPARPGQPWLWYLGYPFFGFIMIARAADPVFSLQFGAMTVVTIIAAVSFSAYARSINDIDRLFTRLVWMSAFWCTLGVVGLRGFVGAGGGRYAGFFSSAGIFVQTGGVLLPFCVWGMFRPWNQLYRLVCVVLAVGMVVALVASGQRTGTFAGVIACTPLLARRSLGRLVVGSIIAGVCFLILYQLFQANSDQAAFVARRFLSTSTSNRSLIWKEGLREILDSPFLGHGLGMNGVALKRDIGAAIHNMYLAIWFDTGILGLAMFLMAMLVATWQALRVSLAAATPEISNAARVLFGTMLASWAAGQFSTGASSPSDIFTVILLMTLVLSARLSVINQEEKGRRAWHAMSQQIFAFQMASLDALSGSRMGSPRTESLASVAKRSG